MAPRYLVSKRDAQHVTLTPVEEVEVEVIEELGRVEDALGLRRDVPPVPLGRQASRAVVPVHGAQLIQLAVRGRRNHFVGYRRFFSRSDFLLVSISCQKGPKFTISGQGSSPRLRESRERNCLRFKEKARRDQSVYHFILFIGFFFRIGARFHVKIEVIQVLLVSQQIYVSRVNPLKKCLPARIKDRDQAFVLLA